MLTATDLMGCHRVNQVYLCDRHGVLNKQYDNTCLGSLYNQNFQVARNICQFTIEPVREIVYQLVKNWFVIFSPIPHTVPITCRNGSATERHVPRGPSRFHLSPGCTANFQDHIIQADLSIKLPSDFIQFEWEWEPLDDIYQPIDIVPALEDLRQFGLDRPRLSDVQTILLHRLDAPSRLAKLFTFIGTAISLSSIFLGILVFIYRFKLFIMLRNRFINHQPGNHYQPPHFQQLLPQLNNDQPLQIQNAPQAPLPDLDDHPVVAA